MINFIDFVLVLLAGILIGIALVLAWQTPNI